MANGRELKYIIKLIANDQAIRQQMKSWDWEDIMGTKGKEFGDFIADNVNGREAVENAFKGVNIDWNKILGAKEITQLEQALARSLQKNKGIIQDFANEKNAAGVQGVIDYFVELGKEFQEIGSNFDVGQLARSMGSFMKVISTDKVAKFVTDTEKLVGIFDKLVNAFDSKSGGIVLSNGIEGAAKQVDTEAKKIEESLNRVADKSKKITINVNSNSSSHQFEQEVNKISDAITELDFQIDKLKIDSEDAVSGSDKEYEANIALANAYVKRAQQYKKLIQISKLSDKSSDAINNAFDFAGISKEDLEDEFNDAQEEAKKVLNKLSNKNKQASNAIGIGITTPSANDIIKAINTTIDEINNKKKALHTIKLNVDDQLNPISGDKIVDAFQVTKNKKILEKEISDTVAKIATLNDEKLRLQEEIDASQHKDTTRIGKVNDISAEIQSLEKLKEANEALLADIGNPAVQYSLSSIMNSFNAIDKVISNRQNVILEKTTKWRQKMIEAMTTSKNDINIQIGFDKGLEVSTDAVYNYLQQYFQENQIELHINKEELAKEIKEVVGSGGISIGGGGTVDLNEQSLKSAIAEGFLAALTGGLEPTGANKTETPTNKAKSSIYLDPNSPYMKHMAEAVRSLAEFSQKQTAPAAKVREFFDRKFIGVDENGKPQGIQIGQYANANNMDIADMLSQLIKKYGVTLLDEFDTLIQSAGKNRTLQQFRGDLSELLYYQNINSVTVDDDYRRRNSIEIFKNLVEKSKMLEAFNIKNPKWQIQGIEDFDKIFSIASKEALSTLESIDPNDGIHKKEAQEYYNNIVQKYESLRTVIANKDGLDATAQKERLEAAIIEFRDSIRETYNRLYKYVNAHDMDVFVDGAKKPYSVHSRGTALRADKAIGGDYSKIKDVRVYDDISTGALGVTSRGQELKLMRSYGSKSNVIVKRPDRTDILNKKTKVDDFVKKEDSSKPWEDENTAENNASKRASKASDLLKESEARVANAAAEEAAIEKQIEEKRKQKESLENEISVNKETIAKENDNPRKLAGARKRLANRKAAVDVAQKERDAAELNKKILDATDMSKREKELADINAKRAKYNSWIKNPDEYDDDIVDAMYRGISASYLNYKKNAKDEVNSLERKIAFEDKNIEELRKSASDASQQGDITKLQKIEKEIEDANRRRDEYVRSLPLAQERVNEYDKILSEIYAKVARGTDESKAAFNADFQTYMSKEMQKLDEREAKLGVDPRVEAEEQLTKADKALQKAQGEYDKVAESDEGKKVIEIDKLVAKNKELEAKVENLDGELKGMLADKEEATAKKAIETTSEQLALAPKKEEIDTLITEVDKLDNDISQAKKEAEEVDKRVRAVVGSEDYKKPEYDIKHTKTNQTKLDKYYNSLYRASTLTDIANNEYDFTNGLPDNLTATMKKIIESLAGSREALSALSQDFGLDKYDTNEALTKEINARLSKSKGKNKLSPIIEEFYNKILTDGIENAKQWLESTKVANEQNINKQENKLKTLAKNDLDSVKKLESVWKSAETALSNMFHKRTNQWLEEIKKKIASLDQDDVSQEQKDVTIYEIDELFKLTQNADSQYSKHYKNEIQKAVNAQKVIDSSTSKIAELEKQKAEVHEKINLEEEKNIQEQIKIAKESLKGYQKKKQEIIAKAKENGKAPDLSFVNNGIIELEKQIDELYAQSNLRKEQEIQKQIADERKKIKHYKKRRKDAVNKSQPWSDALFTQEQRDLLDGRRNYSYSTYLGQDTNAYTSQRNVARSDLDAKLAQREPILQTRQAELLRDIKSAIKSGEDYDQLEKELAEVNDELAKYTQYHHQVANDNLFSMFQSDIEFAEKYKNSLREVIELEQQADLAKAKGVTESELSALYSNIDSKRGELTTLAYDQLQAKQTNLLREIDVFSKEGKDIRPLVKELELVNTELVEYELNVRRVKDMRLGEIAYNADVAVMRVYNDETREAIKLEQKLALARAKNEDVENALSAQRSQSNKRIKAINRAQENRMLHEDENSARAQALRYLSNTEKAYREALQKRATVKRRVKIKQSQIDDIENDNKYSTSWQYKRHQRVVKDRLVGEYVGSDQYYQDREAGKAKVETAMRAYLAELLPPDAIEKVLYQLKKTMGKRGEKLDPSVLAETYKDILFDNEDYKSYLQDRELEYQRIIDARAGTVNTGVTDLDLAISEMHASRDALKEGRNRIEKEKQENIDFINSVSEKDYAPLKQEMEKVASRIDFDSMIAGFKDIVIKNISEEAKINQLKNQVVKHGGNQTEANHLAELLRSMSPNNLKNVKAWSENILSQVFITTEEEFRKQARQNLIDNEDAYAQKELDTLQRAYTQSENHFKSIFNRETNKSADVYLNKYLGSWVENLLSDEAFQSSAGTQFNDIVSKFKSLLEQNVYNLVSNYAEGLVVENGVLNGIDIREEVRQMLLGELDILLGNRPDINPIIGQIDSDIAHIEQQRKAAMEYGGIGYNEVADTDVLKEQALIEHRLTAEKEKQKELTEQIAYFEGSDEELGRLNRALDETNTTIARLQMLFDNRDVLLELHHEARANENAAQEWTPEQQRLWITNKLEAAKANLESEDASVKTNAERQVEHYTEMLNRLEAKIATEDAERRKDSSVIGILTKALRDAFGGKGGFALDATGIASEATLTQILQILTGIVEAFGGQVVRDPEMEKKLARMRELEAKRGTASVESGSTPRTNKKKTTQAKSEYPDGFNFVDALNKQATEVAKHNKGTKEYVLEQAKLYKLLWDYKNSDPNLKSLKNDDLYKRAEIVALGLDPDLSKAKNRKEAWSKAGGSGDVEKLSKEFIGGLKVATQESAKQVENEKKETAETEKQADAKVAPKTKVQQGDVGNVIGRSKKEMANEAWKSIPAYNAQEETFTSLQKKAQALKGELDKMYDEGNKDTVEFIQKQTELSHIMSLMRKKYSEKHPEVYGTKGDKESQKTANETWQRYLTTSARGRSKTFDNLDNVPLTSISKNKFTSMMKPIVDKAREDVVNAENEAKAKERTENAESNITEENKEQVGYLSKLQEILGGITKDTKGKANSLNSVYNKLNTPSNKAGVKPFEELREELLKLQSGNGSIDEATKKARAFIEIFAKYKNNRFADLSKWFGKDVQADATSLLGIVKQIFELTSREQATRKATGKSKEEVQPAQQKAEAKEREAAAEERITEEQKEQEAVAETKGGWTNAEKAEYNRLSKETEDYSPKVIFGEGGTFGGLALDSTLQDILTAIRNIQDNGIKKGGSGSSVSRNKKKSEADLIRDRALSQDAVVRGLAAGRGEAKGGASALYAKYEAEVEALNKAVDEANKQKKNKQSVNINAVKTAAAKVAALTKNILRDTAEWDYIISQSDKVVDYKLPQGQKMTKERMEEEAKKTFDNKKEEYEFLSFDEDTLIYQLTDLEGKIRTVTMKWSDFNQQIAITSDKSVGKLGGLADKVNKLKTNFEGAKDAGYLSDSDEDLNKFLNKLKEIDKSVANGSTFENIEKLRNEAIALGDVLNKKVNKNKGWMVGTGAKKQVENQHDKIFGARLTGGEEFASKFTDDSQLYQQYVDAYDTLKKNYDDYVKSHQINDPKIQQKLQQEATKVQMLGEKYLSSVTQAEKLNDLVKQSGTYKDVRTGEEVKLGGTTDVTAKEVTNLKAKMLDYVKNGLGQANIEGVKFDNVNKRLIYTFRTSKNSVADMVVQYDDVTHALYAYQKQERESLTGLPAFLNSMKSKMRSILQYTASITSIYRVFNELKRGVQYIKEIDSALTELKKVTDETEKTYDRFLKTAAKTADKVGSTIKEVVSSTADWARIGYSFEEAATLAESTAILLNVSEFQSIDEATSALTSTLQAFGYTANESMNVVDVLNEVGNNFAISSDGIATALQDSASSLMAANNSYEQAVSLIAAANRVVQDPNSVGKMLCRR